MKKLNEQTKIKIYSVDTNAPVCPKIKKKDDTKIFEIKKLNNVGADASVRPQKKKEKNNRAGRRGRRPLQALKSNLGITLIALIITIIVLLILAGVTLNIVIGENGIFGKANNAKNKTEVAQYEEELRMCILELQTDEATKGTTFGIDTIRNNLVQKVNELQNTNDIEITTEEGNATIEGIYKGYEFTIDEKYVAHIGEKTTGIRILTNIEPTGWTKGPVKVNITIKSNNGLAKIKPENEEEIDVGGKTEYVITKENIEENTTYKYDITDSQGTQASKTVEITTIDKNAPANFTITAENAAEGLKITGEATDAESGIEKIEYYVKKSTDEKYTKYDSNPIIGLTSGIYSVYAIAYDKAGNTKKSNTIENVRIAKVYKNVNATTIKSNPEKYYGTEVQGFESYNGQTGWKVFYVKDYGDENPDNDVIFLITGDYIEASKVDIEKTKMTRISGAKYIIYWSNWPQMQKMNHNELFNIENAFDIDNSTYTNAKCISTLLNTENWTEFLDKKDGSGKASYAIGGPTVEMWMKSWNEKYPETNEKYKKQQLLCNKISSIGYLVGIGLSSEIANSVSISSINELDGYNYSTLYYPQKGGIHDGNHYLKQYWMASPVHDINGHDNVSILTAVNYGYIGFFQNMNSSGLRPVIALKPGVTLNLAEVD